MAAPVQWSSRFGFLMAAVGFAVGPGNIWRFPYVTGENGGGAFVLVYLICVLLIGIPIVMAELLIGRRGRKSPPGSIATVAESEGRSISWAWVGNLNLLTALAIVTTYCVVSAWILKYFVAALSHGYAGLEAQGAAQAFESVQQDTRALLAWTLAILLMAGSVLYAGVEQGIERVASILMPLLFALLLGLAVYNAFSGGFIEAVDYLFQPDFSQIGPGMVIAAIGQAFFSIGVAMAGMMTFGAYLDRSVSIGASALVIGLVDTLVALVAGLVVFPLVFRFGFDPASGTGLIFQTLPVAFAQMPGGQIVGSVFFLLLSVAAVTSIIGLLEPLIAWSIYRLDLSRSTAVVVVFTLIWMLSTVSVLGYGLWSESRVFGLDVNSAIDFVSNQIMLPLGGLLIALFAGWVISNASARRELRLQQRWVYSVWRLLMRYLVPVAVAAMLIAGLR